MIGDPESDLDWLNLALESHARIPFHGILLSRELLNSSARQCDALIDYLGALDSDQWTQKARRTHTLRKASSEYKLALAPLLRHAKTLTLIDPWLNCAEPRYFDTVTICSNLMGQRGQGRLQGRIHIHAELKQQRPYGKSLSEYLSDWEQKLQPLASSDRHRFKVFLWESLPGSETLHDRFILTDQCGISAPGGLDCRASSHANSTDWSLLDEEVRIKRLQDYDEASSPFKLEGSREVLPPI